MQIYSEPGIDTTFTQLLPATDVEANQNAPEDTTALRLVTELMRALYQELP